jgi:hypothetical protein
MARILSEEAPARLPDRLREWLLGARWSTAAAMALAALVAGGAWIMGARSSSSAATVAAPVALAVAPVDSLRVTPVGVGASSGAVRPARFVVYAPGAREVRLAGEFTAWQPAVPLADRGHGIWEATLLLPPGRHAYMFVVDGTWTTDPLAPAFRDDGFGSKNAVMEL